MARKRKNNSENNSSENNTDYSFFYKLFRPLKILIKLHIKIASKELKKDFSRYVSGMISLIIGLFFISSFIILLNVLIIFAIKEFTVLNLFYSVLILTSLNLISALICIISAGSKFKKPFLYETKKVIKETIKEME